MTRETEEATPDPETVELMMRSAVDRSREHVRSAQALIERSIFRTGVDRVEFHVEGEPDSDSDR